MFDTRWYFWECRITAEGFRTGGCLLDLRSLIWEDEMLSASNTALCLGELATQRLCCSLQVTTEAVDDRSDTTN